MCSKVLTRVGPLCLYLWDCRGAQWELTLQARENHFKDNKEISHSGFT